MRRSCNKGFRSGKEGSAAAGANPIWDCGSPLYDSHELVSIAYTIERHMMAWPHLGGPIKPIIITQQHYHHHDISLQEPISSSIGRRSRSVSKGRSSSSVLTCSPSGVIFVKSKLQRKLNPEGVKKKHKKMMARFSGFYDGLIGSRRK